MARHISDDEADLKRRARRRLVGAVTLVTLVVVLLPMLLDSEPRQTGVDIELHIPDKDMADELKPGLAAPAVPASSPAAADVVPEAASQATPTPEAPAAPPASALQKPKPSAARSGFVVQIGAFANADSAHQLQEKLGKQGIKTYTERVDDKTRVRAGPFPSREAADKLRRKLEAQGLKPVVGPVQ